MSIALDRRVVPVRAVLDNGLVTIAHQTHTHPAVTVLISVHAGSAYDPADALGCSYFVSRVLDRGTEQRTADDIAEALDSRGVSLSAGVSRHLFTVAFTCLADDLPAMLDLAADVIRRPVFPEREVTTRRAEIVTTIRQDEDSPAAMASEGLMELLYPQGHPYGRLTKGTVHGIEAMTRDVLAGFHRERFTPSGTTAIIVGEVEPDRAIDLVTATLGDWRGPSAALVIPPSPDPATHRQLRTIAMPNKAQADIAYGFVALRRRDPEYYAAYVMNTVLGQYGLGGRLGDSIRERQGMAYYAFSSFEGNLSEAPLVVRAGVAPGNVERAIESIDRELQQICADGVAAAELADAKQYLIGSMPRMLETNSGIASFLQSVEVFQLGLDYERRVPALVEQVTADEVVHAARRILDPARAAIVVAGPPAADTADPM